MKKFNLAAYIWAPVEGSGALLFPFTHMPPSEVLRPGSYTLKGQSWYMADTAHISGLCESSACLDTLRPEPSRSKGLSH